MRNKTALWLSIFAVSLFTLTDNDARAQAPYSPAVKAGDMLYLSGIIAVDPDTRNIVDGGVQPQTEHIFGRMTQLLATYDLGLSDLVNCNVYLTDMGDYGPMNETYGAQFVGRKPARTTVEVSALPLGADIEIACIAYMGDEKSGAD